MSAVVLLPLMLVAPAPLAARLQPAVVKFLGSSKGSLLFEVTNPNSVPLPYVGYRANAFSPPLKEGTMAPLYQVELRSGKMWKPVGIGWCGWGIGEVAVPARGKATFDVAVPEGQWDEVRVGLQWHPSADRKVGPEVASSGGISRKAAFPGK